MSDDLVAGLQAAVHHVLAQLGEALAPLGLTHAECNALHQLDPDEPRPVRFLQAATGQRASTLTSVLDRLERRQLIRRELNPDDRRSFTIALTAAGAKAAIDVDRAFAATNAAIVAGLTAQDLEGFRNVIAATVEASRSPS